MSSQAFIMLFATADMLEALVKYGLDRVIQQDATFGARCTDCHQIAHMLAVNIRRKSEASGHDFVPGLNKLKYSLSSFLLIHPATNVGQPICFAIHSEDTAEVRIINLYII